MDYRTGKCSQCGAEYKVPASFAHNVARCKVCKGVVHLGAPQSAGGSNPPATGARSGPTKAPTSGAAAMPARRVVPKPVAPPAADAVPPAAEQAAPPPPRPSVTPEAPRRVARPSEPVPRPQPVASAGASTRKGDSSAESEPAKEGARPRGRAARAEKKKPPMAGVLAAAGLVVVAAVLFLMRDTLFGGGTKEAAEVVDATAGVATPAPTTSAADKAASPAPGTEPEAVREPAQPEPEAPKAAKAPKDPNSIDLTAIADFEPTADTSAEEWAQMKEWVAQWMDVDAGAAGNRAKLELAKKGRRAVPAILNVFKQQDFATKTGRSNGDQCQKTLMQICNGTNFDWRYADEAAGRGYDFPDDVYFCKRVVEEWVKAWRQVEQNIEAWINLAKLKEKDPAEAERLRAQFGGQSSSEPSAAADEDLEVD